MSYSDSDFSSDSSDSSFKIGGKRQSFSIRNQNFEKNYPKNILTSIIACLDLKNYQQVYLESGISEKEIQKRNSASLSNIHKIITHRLINPFNKHLFEKLSSNILLQNSKISKKAFHLLLLREVFSFSQDISLQEFRVQMGKRVRTNSIKSYSNLEFFQYQSSTIYLLTLFCKVMNEYPNLNDEILESRESTQVQLNFFQKKFPQEQKEEKKNRDVIKHSIRELSIRLNSFQWEKEKIERIYFFMKDSISNTEIKLSQNLNLKQGIPFLGLFCPEVVSRCFDKIEKGEKITISNLENLVKQYEKKSLECIGNSLVFDQSPIDNEQKCKVKDNKGRKLSSKIKKQKRLKKFSPIILTHPS